MGKQADELHHLVTEMMDMSTLDAGFLELCQDDLSIGGMIREQLVKLEPLIEGRHLTIQLEETEEFHVTGDEKYLSKAIYNLLDNAVSYSDMEGTIHIMIDSRRCSIENPCEPIELEKLDHLFDAFYQGNTNRGTQGSHRGLGLYLTRKIFALSHLTVEIKNTEQGVKVSFK